MSRESEKLFEAITQVSDEKVEAAKSGSLRPRPLRWIAPVAAVLALAILVTGLLSGRNVSSAYAVAEAQYPKENVTELYSAHGGELESFLRTSVPQLLSGAEGKNRVFSPLNLYIALSMLAEVTEGSSRSQILTLLGSEDILAQRQKAREIWDRSYYTGEKGACTLASSLWLRQDMSYHKETLDLLAAEYYASSFRGEMGSEKINRALQDWLNRQTGDLLQEQAGKVTLPPDTVMALAATIYFKGSWEGEFDKENTFPQTFFGESGELFRDFMHDTRFGTYYWGEHFSAAPLRFSNRRQMLFILPEEGVSPEALLEDGEFMDFLTGDHPQWERQESVLLDLSIPKFDVVSDLNLLPELRAMGVTDVLDHSLADFSPLSDQSAAVTQAKHAARVVVDEEGCVAAAYTVIGASGGTSVQEPKRVDFTLDRPFLFVILGLDDLPLFIGIVNDPGV